MKQYTVTADWLNNHQSDKNLIILDARQGNNKAGLTSSFENIQIKNAIHFDIKGSFSDLDSPFPNMLLNAADFEKRCQVLGINSSSRIVIYDALGIYTSPRVWWMFRAMGHRNVTVLNGGLPEWAAKGYATEAFGTKSTLPKGNFKAAFQPKMVVDIDFVKENINSETAIVIDARSAGRFNGTTPEPRKGLRGGNIPKSVSLPFQAVLENGQFKSPEAIQAIFKDFEITDNQPIVFSCGSGITACIIYMASEMALDNPKAVYDGSWTEWGMTAHG